MKRLLDGAFVVLAFLALGCRHSRIDDALRLLRRGEASNRTSRLMGALEKELAATTRRQDAPFQRWTRRRRLPPRHYRDVKPATSRRPFHRRSAATRGRVPRRELSSSARKYQGEEGEKQYGRRPDRRHMSDHGSRHRIRPGTAHLGGVLFGLASIALPSGPEARDSGPRGRDVSAMASRGSLCGLRVLDPPRSPFLMTLLMQHDFRSRTWRLSAGASAHSSSPSLGRAGRLLHLWLFWGRSSASSS